MENNRDSKTHPSIGLLIGLGCFLVSLVAISGLRQKFRAPDLLNDKWEWLKDHKDEFDAIFLGSSRTFRAFDPARFESQLQSHGKRIHSFNFGSQQLNILEESDLVDRILKIRPARLKYLFLEPILDPNIIVENLASTRVSEFHTIRQLPMTFRYLWGSNVPLTEKVKLTGLHSVAFFYNWLNVGQLSPGNLYTKGWDPYFKLGPRRDGFLAAEDDLALEGEAPHIRPRFLATRALFERELKEFSTVSWSDVQPPTQVQIDFINQMQARASQAGVRLIFVGLPTVLPGDFYSFTAAVHSGKVTAPLIGFNDPEAQRELNGFELRWNKGHLNRAGSTKFTDMFAAQFATLVKARQ